MESRIEDLITKYWEGESSLQEEAEIKAFFQENPSLTPEGRYFVSLTQKEDQNSGAPGRQFVHPGKSKQRTWLSIAASIVLGITVAFFVIQDARRTQQFVIEDPQEAYEITRKALLMVSSGLNEGSTYSRELKKINDAEKIVETLEK